MNFYALIIGTEILNGRREDKHFEFVKKELQKYGHELFASFVVKDNATLIEKTFKLIKQDKDAIMFSFGGIGSTPDDLTREIAAKVFATNHLEAHPQFVKDIIERFGEKAYPHRIRMADLPRGSTLLVNPINNMSGFSLENKYFFVPGFPSMSHPMISCVIEKYFAKAVKKYRKTFIAHTSEETLITLMQSLPKSIELSCLPMFIDDKPQVELSLLCTDSIELDRYFNIFQDELKLKNIYFLLT